MTQSTNSAVLPPSASPLWPLDDRRDSPRIPVALSVRATFSATVEDAVGDISLGGIGWCGVERPHHTRIEATLRLGDDELRVNVEVFGVRKMGSDHWMQARFVDIGITAELLIARWIHEELHAATVRTRAPSQ